MGNKSETDFDWYNPENKLEKKNSKIETVQNKQNCFKKYNKVFSIDRIIQIHWTTNFLEAYYCLSSLCN